MVLPLEGSHVLQGEWHLCLPVSCTVEVSVQGSGEKTETWQRRLGLKGEWEASERWTELQVNAPALGNTDISGTYTLKPKCGTACCSLHSLAGGDTLHLFLDPSRCGAASSDSFVIADNHRRLAYKEARCQLVSLDPGFRPETLGEDAVTIKAVETGRWVEAAWSLEERIQPGTSVAVPSRALSLSLEGDACLQPLTVMACSLPLAPADARHWPQGGKWHGMDLQRSKATFDTLSWVKQHLIIPSCVHEWTPLGAPQGVCFAADPRCAPSKPSLQWHKASAGRYEARENQKEAAGFEQGLKKRPDPFVVHMKCEDTCGGILTAHWRITEHTPYAAPLEPFKFTSCKAATSHDQPPNFVKFSLRPEQQRSLGWMLSREADDSPFIEQEIAEAVLAPLGWRAEARVQRPVVTRGGVVADQVGYGKTAITIALMDCSPDTKPGAGLSQEQLRGRHPVKATLIIVPTQLMNQWPKEIIKFTGDAMTVLVIKTLADLNKYSVKEIEMADAVVTTNNILKSKEYFPRLARLAGARPFPSSAGKGGRMFNQVYNDCLDRLRDRVQMLQDAGAGSALEAVKEAERELAEELALEADVGAGLGNTAKRLALGNVGKGKKATYAAEKKAKKLKAAKEAKGDAEEEEEEEVEEEEEKAGPVKKKAKKGEEEGIIKDVEDPWRLGSSAAKHDWCEMRCAPLELFAWKRVVVDEFTYLESRESEVVRLLTATYRWCLSGTPPTATFQDVKGIAALLGIHLGVDESAAVGSDSREFKQLQKEMTASEKFQARMQLHTPAWHAERHRLAQQFMDRFVRQNIAEIDEIIAEEQVVKVVLTPAERAVYLELDHHLQAMEMKTKKSSKRGALAAAGDREARLRDMLGHSGSAEEALLKRCAHYDLEGSAQSAETACELVVQTRRAQLKLCEDELGAAIAKAVVMRDGLLKDEPGFSETRFSQWQKGLHKEGEDGCGDEEAAAKLQALVLATEKADKVISHKRRSGEELDEAKWELREHVHHLRRCQKELVGRIRSLRYFEAVRDMQRRQAGQAATCAECGTARSDCDGDQWAILSCCGHQGKYKCLMARADMQECPVKGCAAPARPSSVVRCSDLGCDVDHEAGGRFGSKLRQVVQKIQDTPDGDRIIVFVQFKDLAEVVAKALAEAGIDALEVRGSVHTKTKALDAMQQEGGARVLMLNLADESASGANLTLCNHAIFVHPMLADSQEHYTACETQAIGRIRRYGQTKTVHIWRFIVQDTIDSKIYEERHRDWAAQMKA